MAKQTFNDRGGEAVSRLAIRCRRKRKRKRLTGTQKPRARTTGPSQTPQEQKGKQTRSKGGQVRGAAGTNDGTDPQRGLPSPLVGGHHELSSRG